MYLESPPEKWVCWPDYTKDKPLVLGDLAAKQGVTLQTSSRVKNPESRFGIETAKLMPVVYWVLEDGLATMGPDITIVGTCSTEEAPRVHAGEDPEHKGLIVPGEHIVMKAPSIIIAEHWIKGWKTLTKVKKPQLY